MPFEASSTPVWEKSLQPLAPAFGLCRHTTRQGNVGNSKVEIGLQWLLVKRSSWPAARINVFETNLLNSGQVPAFF